MVYSKNMKVNQKRCLGTSTESFTGSSLSEQIICQDKVKRNFPNEIGINLPGLASSREKPPSSAL